MRDFYAIARGPVLPNMGRSGVTRARWAVLAVALTLALWAIWQLQSVRAGLEITDLSVGTTPATVTRLPGIASAPVVVIAHGFAGGVTDFGYHRGLPFWPDVIQSDPPKKNARRLPSGDHRRRPGAYSPFLVNRAIRD